MDWWLLRWIRRCSGISVEWYFLFFALRQTCFLHGSILGDLKQLATEAQALFYLYPLTVSLPFFLPVFFFCSFLTNFFFRCLGKGSPLPDAVTADDG